MSRWLLLWPLFTAAVTVLASWAAIVLPVPDWARWILAGVAVTTAAGLGIAVLLGPVARSLAGDPPPLAPGEADKMTASERAEVINAARHTLIQAATGLIIIGGIVFTAASLWYTAQALDASRQGQVTDRYTKAVEQLGSGRYEVRLGGLYALDRVARDSERDHQSVYEVIAGFIRERTRNATRSETPDDIQTALALLGWRNGDLDRNSFSLAKARLPGADLTRLDLRGCALDGTDLRRTSLMEARLEGALLMRANLGNAWLNSANLRDANLQEADLTGADLAGADLRGADLRGVVGVSWEHIRSRARIDATTLRPGP